MHKYLTTIIFSVILFVVVLCTAYNYHNNTVLESRINTALKFSGDVKSEKSFKEDYYILQQSHDTNLILVVFGLAVAVMGFFTYRSVVERFDYKTLELTKDIETTKDLLIKELVELKISYFSEGADLDNERAQNFLECGDFQNYVTYTFSSLAKHFEWYKHMAKMQPDENHDYMMLVMTDILKETLSNLETSVRVTSSGCSVIEDSLAELRQIQNQEIQKHLSAIHSKFIIVPDDEYYKNS